MNQIKIIIVDDHAIFRNGLKILLEKNKKYVVVAEASNGEEFLDLITKFPADIVFMDINMPKLDGIHATKRAVDLYKNIKIIALTSFSDKETLNKMLAAGVDGFMHKNIEPGEIDLAIQHILAGHNYFSDEILETLTKNLLNKTIKTRSEITIPQFSERELDVLKLICKGYTNQRIGSELGISDRTVERYKTQLIEKTETSNTLNLVIFAFKNKLVDIQ